MAAHLKLFVIKCVEAEVELNEVGEHGVQMRVKLKQHHFPKKAKKSSFIEWARLTLHNRHHWNKWQGSVAQKLGKFV